MTIKKKSEKTWTYSCEITLNDYEIEWLTITDYFLKHEKHGITRNLIRELVATLDNQEIEPWKQVRDRDIFVEEIAYDGKKYRLIFWFKDEADDWLWVRELLSDWLVFLPTLLFYFYIPFYPYFSLIKAFLKK